MATASPHLVLRRVLAAPLLAAPLPEGVTIVPYSKEHAHAARELMRRVYPGGLNDGGISFEGFWAWLTGDAEYDAKLMFVATADGEVVGFCHCWTSDFIKDLVVAPEWEGRGLGTALLTLALAAFKARGADAVSLKTDLDNIRAQSLYRRLGFEIVERLD